MKEISLLDKLMNKFDKAEFDAIETNSFEAADSLFAIILEKVQNNEFSKSEIQIMYDRSTKLHKMLIKKKNELTNKNIELHKNSEKITKYIKSSQNG